VVDSTATQYGGHRYFTHVSLPRLIARRAAEATLQPQYARRRPCVVCCCERPSSTPLQLVTRTAKTAGKGFAFLVRVCCERASETITLDSTGGVFDPLFVWFSTNTKNRFLSDLKAEAAQPLTTSALKTSE
jgi:hypothetical protein